MSDTIGSVGLEVIVNDKRVSKDVDKILSDTSRKVTVETTKIKNSVDKILSDTTSSAESRISASQARINSILANTEKNAKSKATAIAHVYKSQGMEFGAAMKRGWADVRKYEDDHSKKVFSNTTKLGRFMNTNMAKMKKNFIGHMDSMRAAASKLSKTLLLIFSLRKLFNFAKESIELGSNLTEIQNVVDVVFGSANKDINEFANTALDKFGLTEIEAKKMAGSFGAMAKSTKFSKEKTVEMSETLTGLLGDMSSFYNISHDQAFTKLKSVFSGETKSLKDLGIAMTQANLNEFALSKGIGKTTRQMSEQEKTALRYQFILERLSFVQGDWARTSNTWANQMRILTDQWAQFKTILGQGLINVLGPILNQLNAFLRSMLKWAYLFREFTARMFGNFNKVSGAVVDGGDSLGGMEESASNIGDNMASSAKKIKKSLLGFDKLNILTDNSDAGKGAGGGSVGGVSLGGTKWNEDWGKPFEDNLGKNYDLLSPEKYDEIKEKLKNILKIGGAIGLVFAGWKLTTFIGDLATVIDKIKFIKKLLAPLLLIAAAIFAFIKFLQADRKTREEGASPESRKDLFEGNLGLGVLGAGLGFKLGGASGALAGGLLGLGIGGAYGMGKGMDSIGRHGWSEDADATLKENGAITGASVGGLIGGPMGAAIGGLAGYGLGGLMSSVSGFTEFLIENGDTIKEWFKTHAKNLVDWFKENVILKFVTSVQSVVEKIKTKISDTRNFFSEKWADIGAWVDEHIKTPIVEKWEGLKTSVREKIDNIRNWFNATWTNIGTWVDEHIKTPIIQKWENIKTSVREKISNIRGWFESVWSGIGSWVEEHITGPIKTKWDNLLSGIKDGFKRKINGIIGFINALLSGITRGVNAIIEKVNLIPEKKLPGFLGGGTVGGFNLPLMTAPQIPLLAQGGYVKANTPRLAVIGDNRREGEIVAPESKIQEAVSAQIGPLVTAINNLLMNGGIGGETVIPVYIGNEQIDRIVLNAGRRQALRSGGR